jgi:hypothetical protein
LVRIVDLSQTSRYICFEARLSPNNAFGLPR